MPISCRLILLPVSLSVSRLETETDGKSGKIRLIPRSKSREQFKINGSFSELLDSADYLLVASLLLMAILLRITDHQWRQRCRRSVKKGKRFNYKARTALETSVPVLVTWRK
ncbi:hypothetical protein TNCV_2552821 [Trichonephila clavipes]|nr:hypothetical protein TNCV_2552821 [Trichonephila clavipes]